MEDALLTELIMWTRISAGPAYRELLAVHVRTATDYDAFQATDGTRNRDEVGKVAGLSGRSVGTKWKTWRDAGLVVESAEAEHPTHLMSALVVGFQRPEVER